MTKPEIRMNDKVRMTNDGLVGSPSFGFRHSSFIRISGFVILALLSGCAPDPDKKPTSLRERQEAALSDPYGYKPDMNQNTDVSGGGLFDFDKEAMRKDMDRVFNP